VLFLHAEQEDLLGMVLEQVGDDAETNACAAAGYDVDLSRSSAEVLELTSIESMNGNVTLPDRSGMSVLGSNLLPVMKDMVACGLSV